MKDYAILKRISEKLDDDIQELGRLGKDDIVCAIQLIQTAMLSTAVDLIHEATNKQDYESN